MHLADMVDDIAGDGMQGRDAVDFITEEFNADGKLLIDGDDFHGIAAHT